MPTKTKKTTKAGTNGAKKPLNGYFKAMMEAKASDADSFDYTNKDGVTTTYKKEVAKSGLVVYKASK